MVSTPEGAARGSEPRHEAWDHTAAGRRKPPRGPDQALATLKGSVPWSYSGSPALTGPLGAAAGGGLSPRAGHHVRPLHISCVAFARLLRAGGTGTFLSLLVSHGAAAAAPGVLLTAPCSPSPSLFILTECP